MNWTVGPLPSAVYWRRRAIVAVPVVAVLATFAACAVTGGGGDGGQAALVATTPSDSASTISPSPTESADTYQDGSTAHPYMQTGPPPESPSAAAPAASQVSSAPAPAPSAAPTSPTPSPTPAGPVSCTDKDLSLIAATGAPAYKSGQHPRLSLVVTNTSGRECRRDVGAIQQELRVTAGTRRIGSSADCAPWKKMRAASPTACPPTRCRRVATRSPR